MSLKTRLYRHFGKAKDSEERLHWHSLSKEKRQAFYHQWHGEIGIDLKAAINETMAESVKESKEEKSTKTLRWLDDIQLQEQYAGREGQIEK